MALVWQLVHDVLPPDVVRQAAPLTVFTEALALAPEGPVLFVNVDPYSIAQLDLGGRTAVSVGWASRVSPQPVADVVAKRDTLPQRKGSMAAVLVGDAFEVADDPAALARQIKRVLRPDGVAVGLAAHLDPALEATARTMSPVGLRLVLEEAGLQVVEVLPGPDQAAFAESRRYGRGGWPPPTQGDMSPGNAEVLAWGERTGRRPALVTHRMLQFCGAFAWRAVPSPHRTTPWMRRLSSTVAKHAPTPQASTAVRRFALEVPDGAGTRDVAIEAPESGYIARELAATGLCGYEPDSIAAMLAAADVSADGGIYDIGANIGIFAVVAAACTPRSVVAFEPMPGLATTARLTAKANGLDMAVEEIALAAESGTATFYASAVSDASNSLNPSHRAHSDSFEVVLETLDAYVARTGRTPAVLKIDTETTEPDVIRGGVETIRTHRPWIVCEVLGSGRPQELAELMAPMGYHYYWISDAPRWDEAPAPVPMGHKTAFNWLFAPEPLDDAFWSRLDDWRTALARCRARTL